MTTLLCFTVLLAKNVFTNASLKFPVLMLRIAVTAESRTATLSV